MRVVCPRCRAHFVVAAHLLKPVSRKLKCMQCGAVWPTVPGPKDNRQNPCPDQSIHDGSVQSHHDEDARDNAQKSALVRTAEKEETGADCQDSQRIREREDRRSFGEETEKIAAEQAFSVENPIPPERLHADQHASVTESHNHDHHIQKSMALCCELDTPSSVDSETINPDSPIVDFPASPSTPSDPPSQPVPNGNSDPIPSVFSNGFENSSKKGKKKKSHNSIIRILIGVGALAAGVSGAWYGQAHTFEEWWPALRGHLTGLGFPVIDLIGSLEFSDITALMTLEENVQILIVNGTVQNVAPVAIHLPSMHLIFRDENRRVVRKGEATDLSIPILLPGERIQFVLKLQDPPIGTTVDIGLDRK